jgi:hypothetical protein
MSVNVNCSVKYAHLGDFELHFCASDTWDENLIF